MLISLQVVGNDTNIMDHELEKNSEESEDEEKLAIDESFSKNSGN
jgi:hypothetical protein